MILSFIWYLGEDWLKKDKWAGHLKTSRMAAAERSLHSFDKADDVRARAAGTRPGSPSRGAD